MSAGLVTDPAEVDARWLTAALSEVSGGAEVTGFGRQRIGTGLVGQCIRFTLDWDRPAAGPASVVGKFPSPDPRSRERGRTGGEYLREVRFYQHLAGRAGLRLPRCHVAVLDEPTCDFTLLLDDLAPAVQGDQLAGCTPEQADDALAQAALLHAAYWAHPVLDEEPCLQRAPGYAEVLGQFLTAVWPGFLAEYGDALPPGGAGLGERFVRALPAWAARDRAPRSLVHGDFRVDNMMFGPTGVTVVDWQTVQRGAAAVDVAYLLGASLTAADRRAHEDALVAGYHARLRAAGVVDRTAAQLREDYRRCALSGVVMTVGASMLVTTDERGRRMFATMAERHFTHALDVGAEEFLD
ncbi:phosphotransferase family protein [Pseudonocardia humida]|uniref:Aminoglycoside phosphotransferase family protein n=1 Tax=Pseudonocardia humida TaxID=2800819 RepID=A0ABT0ZZQ0_9PSEU|nr:phosphotransferase [Pseudonocardia humida]MCO1656228.1 aminoglycoside phosphotransferase family protein [Pseudonocardia humida]